MRFGIRTLDEFDAAGKTVLCRVDLNQPVDRATGALKSTARIRASVPTIRELADKGAKVVLLAAKRMEFEKEKAGQPFTKGDLYEVVKDIYNA